MKHTNIDLETLRLFQEILCTGKLSDAARNLDMPKATASRCLADLKEIFGHDLFTRWSGGLAPSNLARELEPQLREFLESADALFKSKPFNPSDVARTIRIGCVDNAAYTILLPALPTIFERAPKLRIENTELDNNLYSDLKLGKLDLAIFPESLPPAGFHSQEIYASEWVLTAAPNHPLCAIYDKTGSLPLKELANYRRIEISCHPTEHYLANRGFADFGNQEIAFVTPYFLLAAMVVNKSDLTVRLPHVTAQRLEATGLVRGLPLPPQKSCNRPFLIWHSRVHSDPAIQWLRAVIMSSVSDEIQKKEG